MECKHKKSIPTDMKFPDYITATCTECGKTIEYRGLVMTSMVESFPESQNVVEISRTYINPKGKHSDEL